MNFQISKVIEILSQTPRTLKSLLKDLSEEHVYARIDEDSWSPFDIVGHLIHGEETDWIARSEIILSGAQDVTFEPFDRFAQYEISKGKTLGELLDRFQMLRARNIEKLRSWDLSDKQLELKGLHPDFGKVTLRQLLATWMVHDLNHIRQIVTVLAKQHVDGVGPWKEYLSILKD
ncbi:MAG: DinB family protein [Pyrinomonadaceae bacterium]